MTQTVMSVKNTGIKIYCKECGMTAVTSKQLLKVMKFTCRACHSHKYGRLKE